MLFLPLFAGVLSFIPWVAAECCDFEPNGNCPDGTRGTPCCGRGKCNVFCCACDGGCRRSSLDSKVASTFDLAEEVQAVQTAFNEADKDGSGNITLNQYLEYMGKDASQEIWVKWFKEHDTNDDGVVTMDETA